MATTMTKTTMTAETDSRSIKKGVPCGWAAAIVVGVCDDVVVVLRVVNSTQEISLTLEIPYHSDLGCTGSQVLQ